MAATRTRNPERKLSRQGATQKRRHRQVNRSYDQNQNPLHGQNAGRDRTLIHPASPQRTVRIVPRAAKARAKAVILPNFLGHLLT